MSYYENKLKEAHANWEKAIDKGDEEAANEYMADHSNYTKLLEQEKQRGNNNV